MQILKDEIHHSILLEAQHLFLINGFERTTMNQISEKVGISKSNMYHYFKSKHEIFYHLTDDAAEGLKRLVMRYRKMRFEGSREERAEIIGELTSLLLAEKYGLLLIMENAAGTNYEGLRPSMVAMLARKFAARIRDEDNRDLLARIIAQNLVFGVIEIMRTKIRPRDIQDSLLYLLDYHTKGFGALQ